MNKEILAKRREINKLLVEQTLKNSNCCMCGSKTSLIFIIKETYPFKSKVSDLVWNGATKEKLEISIKFSDVYCRSCGLIKKYNGDFRSKKEKNKEWRNKNREKINKNSERYKKRTKEWYVNLKNNNNCHICGRQSVGITEAFSFHHTENKKDLISNMVRRGYSIDNIKKELNNCIFVCENCHRKIHYDERQLKKTDKTELQKWFEEIKKQSSCFICGKPGDPSYIDFHHIDNKKMDISNMVSRKMKKTKILIELEKCIPICSCCHRVHHKL